MERSQGRMSWWKSCFSPARMRAMHSTSDSGLDTVIRCSGSSRSGLQPAPRGHLLEKTIAWPAGLGIAVWPRTTPAQPGAFSPQRICRREYLYANYKMGCTISARRPMAGDIQLTCSDCGQDFTFTAADQAFFQERGYSTPKRCKNCRQAKKNDQGGSGYRSAPAQGTPVICSGCGQPTTVPFEPRGDRPVFCRDCYQARKGSGGGGGGNARARGR